FPPPVVVRPPKRNALRLGGLTQARPCSEPRSPRSLHEQAFAKRIAAVSHPPVQRPVDTQSTLEHPERRIKNHVNGKRFVRLIAPKPAACEEHCEDRYEGKKS